VLEDGRLSAKWRAWRQALLTSLADEMADALRKADPETFVSLAAWPDVEQARERLGQDWPTWIRLGVLDFVCPMDYTLDQRELAQSIDEQLAETRWEIPLYPGLGAHRMRSVWDLVQQVEVARRTGADGFVAHSHGSGALATWLPSLRASVAAADPAPMPHWGPPARFSVSGPAMGPPAAGKKVVAAASLVAEVVVGWQPPEYLEDTAGAAQASAMLERMTETRTPVPTYGEQTGIDFGDEERVSGRIVAEDPSGRALLSLGAFDTDARFERTLRLPAPEGPFRIAVYGSATTQGRPRGFVVRGPLLVGATEEDLRAAALHVELDRAFAAACGRPEIAALAGVTATFQIRATGGGGGSWWVRLEEGGCQSGAGVAADPDVTFAASAEDILAITSGATDPGLLYESGALTASGDGQLLRRLAETYGAR
jgi:hypothetical protein